MIIPKAEKLQPTQLKEIEGIAQEFECSILEINGGTVASTPSWG